MRAAAKLPEELRTKIRFYNYLHYPGGRYFDQQRLTQDLSPPLRREVALYQTRSVLEQLRLGNDGQVRPALECDLTTPMRSDNPHASRVPPMWRMPPMPNASHAECLLCRMPPMPNASYGECLLF